jgi:hypothetical protein
MVPRPPPTDLPTESADADATKHDWPNAASDRGRASLPDAYKPKAPRLASADDPASPEVGRPIVDLRKLEEELGRRRLDQIADIVRALTYRDMIELAASIWNFRPEGADLTEHNLPAMLYRWSTRHNDFIPNWPAPDPNSPAVTDLNLLVRRFQLLAEDEQMQLIAHLLDGAIKDVRDTSASIAETERELGAGRDGTN